MAGFCRQKQSKNKSIPVIHMSNFACLMICKTFFEIIHKNVTGFAITRHNVARTEIHFIA